VAQTSAHERRVVRRYRALDAGRQHARQRMLGQRRHDAEEHVARGRHVADDAARDDLGEQRGVLDGAHAMPQAVGVQHVERAAHGGRPGDLTGTNLVKVNPRPTASLVTAQTICNGQSGLVQLQASLTGIGLVIKTRRAFSEWKAILICSGLFLLGLALYFYLPIASMTSPPINWGYPRTVEGFFHVLSRGQYEKSNPTSNAVQFLEQVRLYFIMAGKEFGWPYLLMCVIPFCFLHRIAASERRWILGLLAAYVCLAFLILALLNPGVDRQTLELTKIYFSASYVILALWMGYGLVMLGAWLARPGKQPPTAHFPI